MHATVVQKYLDAYVLLDEGRHSLSTHARRAARAVRDVHRIHALGSQVLGPLDLVRSIAALRWRDFHQNREFRPGEFAG